MQLDDPDFWLYVILSLDRAAQVISSMLPLQHMGVHSSLKMLESLLTPPPSLPPLVSLHPLQLQLVFTPLSIFLPLLLTDKILIMFEAIIFQGLQFRLFPKPFTD